MVGDWHQNFNNQIINEPFHTQVDVQISQYGFL